MDYIDSPEMYVFDLALHGLLAKAEAAGKRLSLQELARRMLIVHAAHVYNPDEFERRVLEGNFPQTERTSGGSNR